MSISAIRRTDGAYTTFSSSWLACRAKRWYILRDRRGFKSFSMVSMTWSLDQVSRAFGVVCSIQYRYHPSASATFQLTVIHQSF